MLAARSALNLEILTNWSVPSSNTDVIGAFNAFTSEVDNFTMQVKITNARRRKLYSVALNAKTKEEIRDYLNKIRSVIDVLEVSDRKREALYKKLSALQEELDRSRTRFEVVAAFILESSDIAEEAGAKLKFIREWMDSISRLMGRADGEEKAQQHLPRQEETKRIESTAKKSSASGRKTAPDPLPPKKGGADLDDEIPF